MARISIKSGLKVEDYKYKKITVLEIVGSLTSANFLRIKNDILSKFDGFEEYVAIDMSKVPFVSMETIKELININKVIIQQKKKAFLIKLPKPVYHFLISTAIANIFEFRENEEQVFQEYLIEKNLTEDEVELQSEGSKLNKWYKKLYELLMNIREPIGDAANEFDENAAQLNLLTVAKNVAVGRSMVEAAQYYKMNCNLSSVQDIADNIKNTKRLSGYILDGFSDIDEIKLLVDKIRFTESDLCRSLLPILIALKQKSFEPKKLMSLSEMVYYMVEDTEDRESRIVKKIRSLYQNIDKILLYLTLNIKLELAAEICTFYFKDEITEADADLFDMFLADDFVDEMLGNMFTVNFNYYDVGKVDDLFVTTIENISERFEHCVHFISKKDTPLNNKLKSDPDKFNINVL